MSFTLVNSAATGNWSSNSFSYSFPSGAPSAGQLDIIGINMFSGTLTVPSGWALARSTTTTAGGTCNQYLIWKVAGASDSSSVTLANNISGGGAVLCWARYSATGAITADSTGGGTPTATNNSNAASAPATSLPLAGTGELAIAYAGGFNGSALSGLTWGGGFSAASTGADGFNGVTDAMGYDLSASGTQVPTLSWTSGNLEAQFTLTQAFIAAGSTAHTATASLTVAPSRSLTRVGAHPRTGALSVTTSRSDTQVHGQFRSSALAVTPARSLTRVGAHPRTVTAIITPTRTLTRTGAHPRTATLTVTPSLANTRVRGHFRTALLSVLPSRAISRTGSHPRTAAIAVIPVRSASRLLSHSRTASFTALPAFQAIPAGGTTALGLSFRIQMARITWQLYSARNQ
jgi:hypothetical protein